jgi:hypothetical protein
MADPARKIDDGPIDPAEGPMPDAAFEIIQRAHEICGHPPAVDRSAELEERAGRALAEARAILDGLGEVSVDETSMIFPAENFEMGDYDGSTFAAACRKADAKARAQPVPADIQRTRRLLDDGISLDRAWAETNSLKGRAANSTLEALMFSLRSGVSALKEPDTRRRLAELSDEQVLEVGGRLQRLKPEIARAWTADELEALMQLRETLR